MDQTQTKALSIIIITIIITTPITPWYVFFRWGLIWEQKYTKFQPNIGILFLSSPLTIRHSNWDEKMFRIEMLPGQKASLGNDIILSP